MVVKKRDKLRIDFLGKSVMDVTQSCYAVSYDGFNILLDYGLYQSQNIMDSYKINHTKIKGVKPTEIDCILISHANIDHCGALPYLYKNGCQAPIYLPKGNAALLEIMLRDSAKIMESDAVKLSRKNNMRASPLYNEDDIEICLSHFVECDFGTKYMINDDVSCEFKSAHHIINSAQILLTIENQCVAKRILYTGDIGSPHLDKAYVLPFEETEFADIVIGECTYGSDNRNHSNKDREKDIEKIKSIIEQTCFERKKKVLFPVFSLDRLQTMLTTLYKIYGNDRRFKTKIIIDTPLGIKISKLWSDIIQVDKELWNDVFLWDNIILSDSWADSLEWQNSNEPMIVLASSGMCTNGRSVAWVKRLLPCPENHICFCGYSAEDSLAYKIKQGKSNKYITIEGESIPNKCNVTSLFSFSSHACRSELLELYSSMGYNKLFLVHSELGSKSVFMGMLKEELRKQGKTCRVIAPYVGDYVYL